MISASRVATCLTGVGGVGLIVDDFVFLLVDVIGLLQKLWFLIPNNELRKENIIKKHHHHIMFLLLFVDDVRSYVDDMLNHYVKYVSSALSRS